MSLNTTDYNAAYAAYTVARNAACDAWRFAKCAAVNPPPQCPDNLPDFLTWCLANGYASDMNESYGQ